MAFFCLLWVCLSSCSFASQFSWDSDWLPIPGEVASWGGPGRWKGAGGTVRESSQRATEGQPRSQTPRHGLSDSPVFCFCSWSPQEPVGPHSQLSCHLSLGLIPNTPLTRPPCIFQTGLEFTAIFLPRPPRVEFTCVPPGPTSPAHLLSLLFQAVLGWLRWAFRASALLGPWSIPQPAQALEAGRAEWGALQLLPVHAGHWDNQSHSSSSSSSRAWKAKHWKQLTDPFILAAVRTNDPKPGVLASQLGMRVHMSNPGT